MKNVNLILIGFGHVGSAFFDLLSRKHSLCRARYGVDFQIRAVLRTKKASYLSRFPSPADELIWNDVPDFQRILKDTPPGAVVMCLASRERDGQPGVDLNLTAFRAGWDVATADKAPLAAEFFRLMSEAGNRGKRLKISGAAAAALPALDTALHSLAGAEIVLMEGILNGTSNYILTRIQEGLNYSSALKEARDKGIAEPDPSLDVEGWDTAKKMLILSNVVFQENIRLEDIPVQGITHLDNTLWETARSSGQVIKLLGRLRREGTKFQLDVGPRLLSPDHPLAGVRGADKGISFDTDSMGRVTVTGGRSDPRGAAAALLKDLISLYSKPIF
ncbi:MAG: homoserine dehydrogenase [Candidatus Aminicenantes bacterium]